MIGIDNIEKAVRDPELIAEMLGIWEASVRASHHFLTDGDILRLVPQVEEALRQIETLWGVKQDRDAVPPSGLFPEGHRENVGSKGVR